MFLAERVVLKCRNQCNRLIKLLLLNVPHFILLVRLWSYNFSQINLMG